MQNLQPMARVLERSKLNPLSTQSQKDVPKSTSPSSPIPVEFFLQDSDDLISVPPYTSLIDKQQGNMQHELRMVRYSTLDDEVLPNKLFKRKRAETVESM